MSEARVRARLVSEGLDAQAWGNAPHERYAEHRHAYDKVLVAAAGSITFRLPELGQDVRLATGDRLHLPAGTLHGADVGPSGVTCLEAHLPPGSLGATPELIAGWGDAEPGTGTVGDASRERLADEPEAPGGRAGSA